jgi:hypothetical protein
MVVQTQRPTGMIYNIPPWPSTRSHSQVYYVQMKDTTLNTIAHRTCISSFTCPILRLYICGPWDEKRPSPGSGSGLYDAKYVPGKSAAGRTELDFNSGSIGVAIISRFGETGRNFGKIE